MTSISSICKRFVTESIPLPIQLLLYRRRYLRVVASIDEGHEPFFSIIKHLVTSGDHVMDIGANIGTYSMFLSSLVGSDGLIYAVEPLPRNALLLAYVVDRLRLGNVTIRDCAISEVDGQAEMAIPRMDGYENYYRAAIGQKEGSRSVKVVTRSIDSILHRQSPRISFIKIDVEGHELPCIKGALETLKRDQPALLIEVSEDPDDPVSTASALFYSLRHLGYQAHVQDNYKVRARIPGEKQGDYFFLTSDHLHLLSDLQLMRVE